MIADQQLTDIKSQITAVIRQNFDRGFVPYSGCNRICAEMMAILQDAENLDDRKLAFDIHILILLKVVKLISHADTSSGAVNDVLDNCLYTIEKLCKEDDGANEKHFFDTIIKTAKNKLLIEWSDFGYRLLKSTVYLVHNPMQAQKVYDIFPILGPLYDGKEYPEMYLITLGMIERLEGPAAAEQYLMERVASSF
jgi:fructose-1,6-bisphosphatase